MKLSHYLPLGALLVLPPAAQWAGAGSFGTEGALGALGALGAAARPAPPLPEDLDAAALLPDRTLLYAEAPGLSELLAQGLEHPYLSALLESELGRALLEEAEQSPEELLAAGDAFLGQPLLPALSRLSAREAALGVALKPGGPVWAVILRADDGAVVDALLERASAALEEQVGAPGFFDAPQRTVRGAHVWSLGDELQIARRGELVVASSDGGLLEDVVDRAAGAGHRSLAGRESFQEARAGAAGDELLWVFVDRERIEKIATAFGQGEELQKLTAFGRRPEAHFLLGPGVAALGTARTFSAAVHLEDRRLAVRVAGHGAAVSAGLRPPAEGLALPLPAGAGADECGSALLYRDFAEIYAQRTELFEPEAVPGISKSMSELALFFGGKDLGEEVLPHLSPWIRFVSRPVRFHEGAEPEVRLPAAALLLEVDDPATVGHTLVGAFQTLIGIVNVQRAQEGQDALTLSLALEGELQVTTAHFPAPREGDGVDIQYNLRPACVLVGETFVVGTHEHLVRELARELRDGEAVSLPATTEQLVLSGPSLARFVEANRDMLVMQQVYDEGTPLEEARGEIDGLRAVLELVRSARVEVRYPDGETVELAAEIELAYASSGSPDEPRTGASR